MSSTYTSRNRLDKQGYGDNDDTWGINNLNTDLDLTDEALDGVETVPISGATTTLTSLNGASDQSRNRWLILTGVLSQNNIITAPSCEKWYGVVNNCTGGFTVTIKTSAGVAATLPAARRTIVYCNGTDFFDSEPGLSQLNAPTSNLSMGTFKITSMGDGSASADAATYGQMIIAVGSSSTLMGLCLFNFGYV